MMVHRFTLAFLLLVTAACWERGVSQTTRQRLILKDGSYQVVTSYQVVGDRVRYHSAERGDEIEEIPYALVDWPATEAWKKAHAPGAAEREAEQEAAALDAEARAEKLDDAARRPLVAAGLHLPDESGVWGLDTFAGTPEVVRVEQADGDLNRATGHSVRRGPVPVVGERGAARPVLRMNGYKAKVEFHVDEPVFYVSIDASRPDEEPPANALTVDTHGASSAVKEKPSASSPDSRYFVVRTVRDKASRVVFGTSLAQIARGGEDSTPMQAQILPGRHWMKLTPRSPLSFGEYVLVEVLPSGELNLDGWDFGVEPRAPENKNAFAPLVPRSDAP